MSQRRPTVRFAIERLESRTMLAAAPAVYFIAGGPGGDHAYGIATDAADHLYLAGLFSDTVDFDPGPGVVALNSNGGADMYVAKYDASRGVIWARQFGGAGRDIVEKLALDRDGNTYILGTYEQTVIMDSVALPAAQSASYLAKLDASGTILWARSITPGATSVIGVSIAVDDRAANPLDRGVYLAQGSSISRLSAATGNTQWTKVATGAAISGVALDPSGSGSLVFTGTIGEKAVFGAITLKGKRNDSDGFVAKSDVNGNFLWAKAIATNPSVAFVQGGPVAVSGGDIYVAGVYSGSVKFDGFTLSSLSNSLLNNRYIAKLDANGAVRWAQSARVQEYDSWNGSWGGQDNLVVSGSGDLFFTGSFGTTTQFGNDVLTPRPYGSVQPPTHGLDAFVSELNATTGQFVKSWRFGGEGEDQALTLARDNQGGVFIAGYVNRSGGTADFPDGTIYTSPGSDIAVLKFSVSTAPAALVAVASPTAAADHADVDPQRRLSAGRAAETIRHFWTTEPRQTAGTLVDLPRRLNASAVDRVMRLYSHALRREDR